VTKSARPQVSPQPRPSVPPVASGSFLACDTLIVSVGLIPERDLLREVLRGQASPPWLFEAGNARRVHGFIEGVVADGTTAGTQAATYLASQ